MMRLGGALGGRTGKRGTSLCLLSMTVWGGVEGSGVWICSEADRRGRFIVLSGNIGHATLPGSDSNRGKHLISAFSHRLLALPSDSFRNSRPFSFSAQSPPPEKKESQTTHKDTPRRFFSRVVHPSTPAL